MWIDEIKDLNLTHNRYSQEGEEVIVKFIFDNINTTNKFFVDLGAAAYDESIPMSNVRLLKENGWDGLMIDMAARGVDGIKEYFLTPDNVCEILRKENCPLVFDFLSIDIDSFDFYILDKVLNEYTPRLICAEFNSALPPNSSLVLKYEEGFIHDGTTKYGFSFGAGVKLFKYHGYTLIYNLNNLDLFAIHNSIINQEAGGNPFNISAIQKINHVVNNEAIWLNY